MDASHPTITHACESAAGERLILGQTTRGVDESQDGVKIGPPAAWVRLRVGPVEHLMSSSLVAAVWAVLAAENFAEGCGVKLPLLAVL